MNDEGLAYTDWTISTKSKLLEQACLDKLCLGFTIDKIYLSGGQLQIKSDWSKPKCLLYESALCLTANMCSLESFDHFCSA